MSMGFVSAGVAAVGMISAHNSASHQADVAQSSAEASAELSRENLDFQRQRYDDWKDIYGDTQEALSDYYSNIKGSTLLPNELNTIEQHSQQVDKRIQETLAQRGMDSSGLSAQLLSDNRLSTEIQKSNAENTIEERVAQRQSTFLARGMGQEANIANGVSGAFSSASASALQGGQMNISAQRNQQGMYSDLAGIGLSIANAGYGTASGNNTGVSTSVGDRFYNEGLL